MTHPHKKIESSDYSVDPFALFEIEPQFHLDQKAVDQKYFALQKQHHPDQKGMLSDDKNAIQSSMINAAYQILKNPVKRAEALLKLAGIPVPGQNGETIQADIVLLEILDFQETIMLCEDPEQAKEILEELNENFYEEQHLFAEQFDHGQFEELPETYIKLSYIDRLRKQVGEVESQLFKRTQRLH